MAFAVLQKLVLLSLGVSYKECWSTGRSQITNHLCLVVCYVGTGLSLLLYRRDMSGIWWQIISILGSFI